MEVESKRSEGSMEISSITEDPRLEVLARMATENPEEFARIFREYYSGPSMLGRYLIVTEENRVQWAQEHLLRPDQKRDPVVQRILNQCTFAEAFEVKFDPSRIRLNS